MALTQTQQIFETWKRARRVLIAFRRDPKHDGAVSALALARILRKLGTEAVVVADAWTAPDELAFVPDIKTIEPRLDGLQKFVITVDVANAPMKEISHQVKDGKLHITLTPESGSWQHEDVSTEPLAYHFDLICTIGAPDFESLSNLFSQHADFFYHTPIVNIDHDPANEHYGQINHVDINATAVSEVIFDLAAQMDRHLIDEAVATQLLTGMISKTRSFRTPNVTPKTLGAASELIALGGRREDIVHHLYRTRTVPVLRLWGRALSRLKHDPATKLVWTLLARTDFIHAGADPSYLSGVIDELIINAPDARVAVILYEDPKQDSGCRCIVHAARPLKATELVRPFAPTGTHEMVQFDLKDRGLTDAEPFITQHLKQQLANVPA